MGRLYWIHYSHRMHARYICIHLASNQLNVGKYTSPMDPMRLILQFQLSTSPSVMSRFIQGHCNQCSFGSYGLGLGLAVSFDPAVSNRGRMGKTPMVFLFSFSQDLRPR